MKPEQIEQYGRADVLAVSLEAMGIGFKELCDWISFSGLAGLLVADYTLAQELAKAVLDSLDDDQ